MARQEIAITTSTITGAPLTPFQEMVRTYSLGGSDGIFHFSTQLALHYVSGLEFSILQGIGVVGGCLFENSSATFQVEQYQNYIVYVEVQYDSSEQTGRTAIVCDVEPSESEMAEMFPGNDFLVLDTAFPVRRMLLYRVYSDASSITYDDERVKHDNIDWEVINTTSSVTGTAYYRILNKVVYLRGQLNGTFSTTAETQIATLPPQSRPSILKIIPCSTNLARTVNVYVYPDGRVTVYRGNAGDSFVRLEAISFFIN